MCIILVAAIAGTAIITLPKHDLVNHNSAKQDSVKSTIDEATPSEATFTVVSISNVLSKTPQNTQPTTESQKSMENTVSVTQNYSEKTQNPTQKSVEKVEETTVEEAEQEDTYEEEYLLDIDNPDDNYIPAKINLTDGEVEELARIVEGEFGGGGFIGCALIAQSIRDAMVTFGYSAMEIRENMQYYGYSTPESIGAYEAIKWIFDGHAVVQHRILVMNNSPGGWHGTQNFVVYYQGVWFYDMWV